MLLVSAHERLYGLPLDNVVEVVRALRSDVKAAKGKAAMTVRGRVVPLVWLSDVFASTRTHRKAGFQDFCQNLSIDEATNKAKSVLEKAALDHRVVSMNPRAALATLVELLEAHPFLEVAFVVRRDGRLVAGPLTRKGVLETAAGLEVSGQDWSSRSWFRNAIQGATCVSEKYVSAATDSLCVTVSTPVKDASGTPLGVLGADVSAALVTDRLYVVIVNDGERQVGVVVDEIVGKRDVEVEPLASAFAGPNLLGTAVLEDERIAMVADMEGVLSATL
ncbi:MAG: chemotaxis protein CheW [Firmicutes bacterium]|nr:chemotaxis protein CheW [Bacillota bacterium]MDH7496648.1 chemotaxis protein CheW [Bacillota bacterium]